MDLIEDGGSQCDPQTGLLLEEPDSSDIVVDENTITVTCFDYAQEDDDGIRVYLNDELVDIISSLPGGASQDFAIMGGHHIELELVNGPNRFRIEGMDEGYASPVTPACAIDPEQVLAGPRGLWAMLNENVSTEEILIKEDQCLAALVGVAVDTYSYTEEAAEDAISLMLEVAREEELSDIQIAYVVATAQHESRLGELMEEIPNQGVLNNSPYNGNEIQYWRDVYAAELDEPDVPQDADYRGRGYVQLTWKFNYEAASDLVEGEIDLVQSPDLASDRDNAAQIIVKGMHQGTFTTIGLDFNLGGNEVDDRNVYYARQIINGADLNEADFNLSQDDRNPQGRVAGLIAAYFREYEEALEECNAEQCCSPLDDPGNSNEE